ncbi:MAG TPA: hypothetical protein VIX35_08550 [Vicinamibacterales bacterium]
MKASRRFVQPGQELSGEQGQAAAKDDAGDLALGTALTEHEHEAADNDGDEGEGTGEGACEGGFEVGGGLLPRRLREAGGGEDQQRDQDEPDVTDGGVDEGRRGRAEPVQRHADLPGSSAAEEPFMSGGYEAR